MLDNVIERSSKAWGLGQNVKICFPPARGVYFSIKSLKTLALEVPAQGVILLGGGGGLAMLALFFALGRFLNVFWVLLSIFWDFSSILNGFWEDLGRVLEDLGRVLIGFFDYFSYFYRKSRFCKK